MAVLGSATVELPKIRAATDAASDFDQKVETGPVWGSHPPRIDE